MEENLEEQHSELPLAEAEATETNNPITEQTMETHAQELHKAPGSGWKHYVFEFLMLFLAVFCGFLAENFREHQVEKERERVFMESMVEDLKSDKANTTEMINKSVKVVIMADSLIHLIRNPECDKYGRTMYYLARKITTINQRFELKDRTYEQMKSSGSLRLICDKTISDSVSTYYAAQSNFKFQEEVQSTRSNSYFDFVGKLFDAAVFQQMLQVFPYDYTEPKGNPALLTHDPTIINEFIGRLHYVGAISAGNSGQARKRIGQTNRLIELIQKEYHIEN